MTNHFKIQTLPAVFVLLVLFLASSCKKDEDLARQKFLGSYNVIENCIITGIFSYTININESSTNSNAIVINNFGDFGINITATVSGNSFSFNSTLNSAAVAGSGSISGNILTITYTLSDGLSAESCTKTCTKQ